MSARVLSLPLRTCREGGSVDLHSTEDDLRHLVRRALINCGVSIKAAALQQGIDISLLSKQLLGREGHVSFNRLARLDPAVLDELAFLLAEHRGHDVRRRNARERREREKVHLQRRLLDLLEEEERERRSA